MRFMVIVKTTPESEKEGALPDPQLLFEMGKYNEGPASCSPWMASIPAPKAHVLAATW
jgi:hypothetical protein